MNLRKKLVLTAIVPTVIVLISGGFALWQTTKILEEFEVINDTYDTNTQMVLAMQVDFKEQIHQWKDILLRGDNPEDLTAHWTLFQGLEQKVDADAAALSARLGDAQAARLIKEFQISHQKLGESYRKSMSVYLANNYDAHKADDLIRGIDHQLSESLNQAIKIISDESEAFSKQALHDAWRVAVLNFLVMLLTSLISTSIFNRSLKKHVFTPISILSDFARKFGAGDYSQRIDFKSDDELGMLVETFNHASVKIESLVDNLETSWLRYLNLMQGVDAIIWEMNPKLDQYTFVNQRAEELLGYPVPDWLEGPGFMETYCHPADFAASQKKIRETLSNGSSGEFTCRALTASGDIIWLNNRIKVIRDDHGHATALLGVMVDITRMKQYEDKMAFLSSHDELTGLANRNLLVDRLERAIAHAIGVKETALSIQNKSLTKKLATLQAKGAGHMTALLLINMDRFKLINESLGHHLGDEVIKSVALRLQTTIGTDDTLARLGADEFAIVLRDISKPEDVAETAREILHRVGLPMEIDRHTLVANCSIGISMYPKDGNNAGDLLRNAGSALTRVKRQEKNNFKFYTEEMNAKALSSLQLENKLRRAIDNREFVLHYQPQISLSENRMTGVEALIRWYPPGEDMVSPMHFIPLAEETNLIQPIGEWVLLEACRQNKAWQDQGLEPFCVAVNLSAGQFAQPDIVERVAEVLIGTGLDPQYLELEITESVMMHDMELVIKNLEELHRLGVKLAIDDFGTGYSSLSYLKRLPIDKLKIDKSFVQDIDLDSDDEAIVAAIIAMAHSLKMGVIAEGVETEAQLSYLRDKECDEIQGYIYSQPLSAELLVNYLLRFPAKK